MPLDISRIMLWRPRPLSNYSQHSSPERALSIVMRQFFPTNQDAVLEPGLRKDSIQKQLEVSCQPQLNDTRNDFCDPDH